MPDELGSSRLQNINMNELTDAEIFYLANKLAPLIAERLIFTPTYVGDKSKMRIGENVSLVNTVFDTTSGEIFIGDFVFFGANAAVVTCRPELSAIDGDRRNLAPNKGCDVHIERGVFIGSRTTIIGPCRIGRHAVIGAGSVVKADIKAGWLYAGVPARAIREVLKLSSD